MEEFRIQEANFTKIREKIESSVYHPLCELSMEAYRTKEPVTYENRRNGEYFIPKAGETWGKLFDCAWFHFTGRVPEEAKGKKCVLLIDFSGEGLVYNEAGEPVQGLTSATSRNEFPLGLWGKRTVEVSDCAKENESIDLWVDAGCNDVEGQYRNDGRVKEAVIATVDSLCRDLFYDWVVCQSLYVGLWENNDPYGAEIEPILREAEVVLAELTPETIKHARELLNRILSRENNDARLTYSSIGHSHLDLLFLWPLRETIRKAARTYSTVLKLMKQFPEYKFGCSQAPLYVWMKQYYPGLYEGICRKIKEGRWEVQGSFFIECDTNLPSGESLVRQLLYGKQFFKEEFDLDMKVGFLPDVFGYSAALPQLLLKSETPYFMTQKLSYNDTNHFPRTTFLWQGMDGSEVLTHMLPEDSYNSAAVPQMYLYGLYHHKDLDRSNEALQLFGLGDGGGGPGYEHMERKRRSKNLKGCPSHKDEFVIDFFERINQNRDNYRKWSGEFYLERHQGTFTSIAKGKLYNRRAEQRLHTLEWLSVMAEVRCGLPYPMEYLEKTWKEILLYQFHDCLPGSAIARVYEEVHTRYEAILQELEGRIQDTLNKLSYTLCSEGMKEPYLLYNPVSFNRREIIEVDGRQQEIEIPAYGIMLIDAAKGIEVTGSQKLIEPGEEHVQEHMQEHVQEHMQEHVQEHMQEHVQEPVQIQRADLHLENDLVSIDFTKNGTISSLILKETGFNMLKAGEEGNLLLLYPDELTHWDINKDYLKAVPEKAECVSYESFEKGDIQGIHFTFTIGHSGITQTVSLKSNSARLDFMTEADWQEEYKMLRVAFPTSVVTEAAQCEIQFGHVLRPTHRNTSWEEAKFEVCAHKWVDMADSGSGVALLNDCKYGYKVWDNILDLCLLRSQNCPCEHGDQGVHHFTYSIYPHTKDVIAGDVVKEGFALNFPLEPCRVVNAAKEQTNNNTGSSPEIMICSPVEIDCKNIVIDTIKKAESGEGYIVRLYEAGGQRTRARITLRGFEAVGLCNLLEKPYQDCSGPSAELEFHKFEVHTLLIKPQAKNY